MFTLDIVYLSEDYRKDNQFKSSLEMQIVNNHLLHKEGFHKKDRK